MHTSAISPLLDRCTIANTAFPTNGPINQPTAPLPAVARPSTRNGSSPNTPAVSMFCCASTEIPVDVVRREVETEARRLYRRRVLRRARKAFQVRGMVGGEVEEGEVLDIGAA